jgi:hypothetical protein
MHPTHEWHSMAAEGAGFVCYKCLHCTCHNMAACSLPCDGSALPAAAQHHTEKRESTR